MSVSMLLATIILFANSNHPSLIIVQFAYCYPYTYSHLQLYLEGVEQLGLDYCSRELLCLSVVSQEIA